jgi:hypothetical protein
MLAGATIVPAMDISTIRDLVGEFGATGLSLTWAAVGALVGWGLLSLVVSFALFFAALRLRWLDPRGRQTWARVLFGLVIFVAFFPSATGVAVITRVRDKTTDLLLEECEKRQLTAGIGQLMLLPVLFAHTTLDAKDAAASAALQALQRRTSLAEATPAEGTTMRKRIWDRLRGGAKTVREQAAKTREQLGSEGDVSFLLDGARRGNAVRALTMKVATQALAAGQLPALQRTPTGHFVAGLAVHLAADTAERKLALYADLIGDLRADADGRLTLRRAGQQVGENLLRKTVVPLVRRPFDAVRTKFILLAVFPPLLILGLAQLVGRLRRARPAAPAASTPSAEK